MHPSDDDSLRERIAEALGTAPTRLVPLTGGSTTRVVRAEMPGGSSVVAKAGPGGHLQIERAMLADLSRLTSLPIPAVRHAADDLLILDYIPHDEGPPPAAAQRHLAELIAELHTGPWPQQNFGYH